MTLGDIIEPLLNNCKEVEIQKNGIRLFSAEDWTIGEKVKFWARPKEYHLNPVILEFPLNQSIMVSSIGISMPMNGDYYELFFKELTVKNPMFFAKFT